MDIRNLGNFANIEAVWEAYPNGGIEGDYVTVSGVSGTLSWNKYTRTWGEEDNPESLPRQHVDLSDLNVLNELHVGGFAEVHGDLQVDGMLRAGGVKQPCLGVFADVSAIEAAFPNPEAGMWAVVLNASGGLPGYIYTWDAENEEWEATGGTAGLDALSNVLLYSAQSLTEAEQKQARANLGMGNGDFATGSDFDAPDSTKRAKVVTVGAVLDGADAVPTAGSEKLVKSGGVYLKINQEKQRAETSEQHLQEYVDSVKEETLEENRKMVNSILENYAPVEINGDVNNAADEEDLTSVNVKGTDVLKFKDKVYNPLVHSGLGKKILRKNIVSGVNVLTRDMLSDENTIYIIQYDYDLNNEEIHVPGGAILKFEGGSLNNGTIVGDGTFIDGEAIINSVRLSGTFTNEVFHSKWFTQFDNNTLYDVFTINTNSVLNIDSDLSLVATIDNRIYSHVNIAGNRFTIENFPFIKVEGDIEVKNLYFTYTGVAGYSKDRFAFRYSSMLLSK